MTDLDRARQRLGKDDLLLVVHDGSFPSEAQDDIGRGSPYGRGARGLYAFARELGFTGVQLGPQGVTSRINPSPYDGTLFSKSPLSIALEELTLPDADTGSPPLLAAATLREIVHRAPADRDQVEYEQAFDDHERARKEAFAGFLRDASPALRAAEAEFAAASRSWLEGDAAHEAEEERARYRFEQFVVHRQHARLRRHLGGMSLFGDWQIGIGVHDALTYGALFVPHYAMGAPPSRTNPDGQPWSYAVLDPAWTDAADTDDTCGGAGRRFVLARLHKSMSEYDALRIDHPHGWIDPWVYDRRDPDPDHAVRVGARLHAAPDLPAHPELARYAIARPEQIDRSETRYADDWVTALDEEQVARYARGFDCIVKSGGARLRVVCEILSTQPYPLARVMQRYGVGRFRVTQKSDVLLPGDVYRSDEAEPADWIMMGNHDTAPMWTVAPAWSAAKREARAAYFAARLNIASAARESWIRELTAEPEALVHAELADVLSSEARHVSLFFADLFGQTEIYNRPGVVDPRNWRLRVPGDYRTRYEKDRKDHRALDLPFAFALALHARGWTTGNDADLFARLRAAAARPLPLP